MEAGIFPTKRSTASLSSHPKSPKNIPKRIPEATKADAYAVSIPELMKAARKSLQSLKECLGEPSPVEAQKHKQSSSSRRSSKIMGAKKSKRKSDHPFDPKSCQFVFPVEDESSSDTEQKESSDIDKGASESESSKKIDLNNIINNSATPN